MKLQFMSDLHINNYNKVIEIEPNAPYLALIGDICDAYNPKLYNLLQDVSNKFERVLFTPGNHEYYENNVEDVDIYLADICNELGIDFLQKKTVEIEGVLLSGCTLWSKPSLGSFYKANDNKWIKNFDRNRMIIEHKNHLDFLYKELLLNENKPHVLLTHYVPMFEMNGIYVTAPYTDMFATDLKHIFKYPIKYWLCGHVHQNLTIIHNNIPCITNCLGNPEEIEVNRTFEMQKNIEIYLNENKK